jgi:hypothetical protein
VKNHQNRLLIFKSTVAYSITEQPTTVDQGGKRVQPHYQKLNLGFMPGMVKRYVSYIRKLTKGLPWLADDIGSTPKHLHEIKSSKNNVTSARLSRVSAVHMNFVSLILVNF